MIAKTRRNFVLITMVLLTAVIVAFVGSTVFINYRSSSNETEFALRELLRSQGGPGGNIKGGRRSAVLACDFLDDNEVYVWFEKGNADLFTSQIAAEEFVAKIIHSGVVVNAKKTDDGNYYGKTDGLCYLISVDNATYSAEVAVIDRNLEDKMLARTTWTLVGVSAVSLVAIFVIVWLLSYRVVRPVETAFNKQRRFISDASHELKTPVTIIRANTEALEADVGQSEWSQNIISQTDRLQQLVEEMLTLARLEEQPLVKEKIDVSSVVESAVLEFEPVAYEQNKTLMYDFCDDILMFAAREDVRRVVTLLTDNAVKYCDSRVDVTFARNSKGARFVIDNDGCLVDEESKERLFERFYREDSSRARRTGGSGLGLATVKAICDRNKWKVSLSCHKGGNMTVTVDMI